MSKHTPGPWITESHCDEGYIDIQPTSVYIDRGRDEVTAEDWANARLIAAAPALLEAGQNAARHFRPSTSRESLAALKQLEAAIALATEVNEPEGA